MAKLWNLPALFGCENNKYGMGTAANRSSALTDYYKRGQYIPGLKVNGMDALAVRAAVKYGKEYTQAENGPLVLEYVTYRYGGHSMSDPGTTYRTREEIQRMRSTNDPIAGLKQKILDWGVVTEDELKAIDKEARSHVNEEVAIAEAMAMAADRLYKEKKIRGFCHLSTGQEAVAIGIEHALTKEDDIITAYRCHGFAYMRGGTVRSIIGELLGRREGIAYGKGGSMRMFAKNFYGGNGIVGAQVPVGAGLAFAHKYNGRKNASVILYGDGASKVPVQKLRKLYRFDTLDPALFGCENNKYGMGTAANRSSALTDYYKRGQYIPG
ncbi:hypothetical protein BN1723_016176, partial [Verticillium longisporum]